MPRRQELLWIPPSTLRPISVPFTGPRPSHVWRLPHHRDEAKPPVLPFVPIHLHTAFLEDLMHDWKDGGGRFRYYTPLDLTTVGQWLLLEWES